MQITHKSRLHYRIQYIVFIALLTACTLFAGWLSNKHNVRSDWTAGKRHSLSQETIQLLQQLSSPVKLRSYQTTDPALNQAINEILQRYKNNKDDFEFAIINPEIFIEQAKADGIQQYGQTVIEYQGKLEKISNLNEESLSNALLRLQRNQKPNLLFVSNHGERDILDSSSAGYSLLTNQLSGKGFNSLQINLLKDTLPLASTEKNVLILGSAQHPFIPSEQQKILDYLDAGGNLLWLQDPRKDMPMQKIQSALNIVFINGTIVDNNPEVSRMLQLDHAAIIPVLEYKLHPITQKMQNFTLFTVATGIKGADADADTSNPWILSDLLISSNNSWSETENIASDFSFTPGSDTPGPLSIGIAQQRQIKNQDSLIAQRVVVIGDTDFVTNGNLGKGANLDFIIKTITWLAEDDQFISITPKTAPDLTLSLSATYTSIIGIFFLIGLPVILFSSGAYIWFNRRKQ